MKNKGSFLGREGVKKGMDRTHKQRESSHSMVEIGAPELKRLYLQMSIQ